MPYYLYWMVIEKYISDEFVSDVTDESTITNESYQENIITLI